MNKKDFLGKTLLFIILVIFMGAFTTIFGANNSMVGVMILVLSLMMLSQNLTHKPLTNFLGIAGVTVAIGISAYIVQICPQIGFFVAFIMVFFIIFTTMHDLKQPIYFPYLLGFAFLIATPVENVGALGIRLISLIVGSLFVVLLNVLINRNRFIKTSEKGIEGLIEQVKGYANQKLNNEEIDEASIIATNKTIKNEIFSSLKNHYFSTPGDRTIMNIATALEQIGLTISRENVSKDDLNDIINILDEIKNYEIKTGEDNKVDVSGLNSKIDKFIENHPNTSYAIISNFKIINHELKSVYGNEKDNTNYDESGIPMSFRLKTILKSNFNRDSVKFTFALRLALLFAIFEFIGVYFNIPNAKWLSFTAIATTLPYLDSVKEKSRMRVLGTIAGIVVFMILYYTCLTTPNLLGMNAGTVATVTSILMILIGYLYTLIDFSTYQRQMVFITIQSLLTAVVAAPGTGPIWERLCFIVISTVICTIANYVILPYPLKKEDTMMVKTYHEINTEEIADLKTALNNGVDNVKSTTLSLRANLLEDKIRANNLQDNDETISEIVKDQTEITSHAMFLRNSINADSISVEAKKLAISSIDKYGLTNSEEDVPKTVKELDVEMDNKDSNFINVILSLLNLYNESKKSISKL
jgi:hypothetical protein